jgi:hypothetical protein
MRGHILKRGVSLQEAIKHNDMKQGLPAYYSKSVHFQIALMMSLLTLTNGIWWGGGTYTYFGQAKFTKFVINNNKCSH